MTKFQTLVATLAVTAGVIGGLATVAEAAPAPAGANQSAPTGVAYVYTGGRKLVVPAGSTWALLPDGRTWAITTPDGVAWATVKKVGTEYVVQPGSPVLRKF